MDGCHRLVVFGIVIHGIIDGFSRFILGLRAADNNKARTVLNLFEDAVASIDGTPRMLRTDKGGENIEAAEYMILHAGSRSVITGRSVHNQRIERLWRDSTTDIVQHYHDLFMGYVRNEGLLIDDNTHKFVLQHIFLAKINAELLDFQTRWNSHQLSTEKNYTPNQLIVK